MDIEKNALLDAFARNGKRLKSDFSNSKANRLKSPLSSQLARQKGNKIFASYDTHDEKMHKTIFCHYNESICSAPVESEELAAAYSDRSALLQHIGKYEHCISDVDKALQITNSNVTKVKLLCSKVECIKELGSSDFEEILKDAKACLAKISNKNNKIKNTLQELIAKAEAQPVAYIIINEEKERIVAANKVGKNKLIAEKESVPFLDAIKIDHNEKYGRHLIANKDYEPGEIIFVEKIYATSILGLHSHIFCQNCCEPCWSGVPCDTCTWAIFCCETCKTVACSNFHDLECLAFSNPMLMADKFMHDDIIAFRVLMIALKKVDCNFENLKAELNIVDNSSDVTYRGFMNDGKFDSETIRSIYSLQHADNPMLINQLAVKSIYILTRLVKCTKLFGDFKIKKVEDLRKNEHAISLGSLFIRLSLIFVARGEYFATNPWYCKHLGRTGHFESDRTKCICHRGCTISSLLLLMNHSCYPNTSNCFIENKKRMVYALQPIKKNEQLFTNYGADHTFEDKATRQITLKTRNNFTCDCIACVENWPLPGTIFMLRNPTSYERELADYSISLKNKLEKGEADQELIRKQAKVTKKALKNLTLPNSMVSACNINMGVTMDCVYGLKPPDFTKCC